MDLGEVGEGAELALGVGEMVAVGVDDRVPGVSGCLLEQVGDDPTKVDLIAIGDGAASIIEARG